MFKNILLATDGSDHARKAAAIASDLAAQYDATLTITSVSPLSMTVEEVEHTPYAREFSQSVRDEIANLHKILEHPTFGGEMPFTGLPAPRVALISLAEAIIDEAEAVAKRAKVKKITRAALAGHPAEKILEEAKSSKADLIVMGTRGLSDLSGLVMGSVSHRVIHLAECPCLTAK